MTERDTKKSSWADRASNIARILELKQKAYGNSFGETYRVLEILYPDGVPVEAYRNMLGIVRILDKLFRLAHHDKDLMGESPGTDIAGYGLLLEKMHDGEL